MKPTKLLILVLATMFVLGTENTVKAGYEKSFGVGALYNIRPTADGNYIILSSTTKLIKINPAGDTLWTKSYPYFIGDCVQVTADGGFVMSGKNSGANQMMVVKTDASGDTLWTNSSIPIPDAATGSYVNNGHHFYIIQTFTNEYVIAGQYTSWWNFSPGLSGAMIVLFKLDANGIFMWEKTFGNYGNGYTCAAQNGASSLYETLDHEYLISGWYATSPSLCCVATQSCWKNQSYLLKTDTSGTSLWNYAGAPNIQGSTLGRYAIPSSDSSFVFLSQNSSLSDVIKIGPTGTVLWDTVITNNDVPYVVKQTNDNGYIIGGASSSGPPLIEKRDASGNLIWRKSGECNNGYILDIIQTSDGYLAAGTTGGNTYLVKIDDADTVLSCFYPYVNLTIDGSLDLCSGDTVTLDAGPGQCNYNWANGATTQVIYVTSDDTINVIASNSCGSDTSATIIVSVNYLPVPNVTITGDTTFCQGDSVIFSIPSCPGCTYLWNNNDTTQAITVNSNSTISLTVSNSCGSATSNSTTVTVNSNPTPTITASGSTNFCQGDSVTLTSSSGISYAWSNYSTMQSTVVSTSGNYFVLVTDTNGCSAISSPISVLVDTFTATIGASGPTTFCQGDSVILTSGSGNSYLWSNNATAQSIVVSTLGNYSVTVTNSNGCPATSSALVMVNPLPQANAGPDATICSGSGVTLNASGGSSYQWSPVDSLSCTSCQQSYATPSNTTIYIVEVTDINLCTAQDTVVVNVAPLPSSVISPSVDTTFCQGDSIVFTTNNCSGCSFLWGNGSTAQSITVYSAGNYSVTITDANGCSASSATSTVAVTNPLNGFSANNTVFYLPGATVTFSASTVGTITGYLWDFGDGNTSVQANPSHSYSTPGNYSISLTVTDNTGCSSTITTSDYIMVEQVFNSITLNTGTTQNLTGVSFTDEFNGWASMGDGNVLITSDGGLNWNVSITGFNGILNSIYLLGNSSYIAGTNGYIAVSINGGLNWNTFNLGTSVSFNSLFFVDSTLGYLAGASGTIYIYNGTNWVLQNTGTTIDFYSVFGIGNVAYAAGANGVIYFYNGATWAPLPSGVNVLLSSVYFLNANIGYAVGDNGTILLTNDGGLNWQSVFNGLAENFTGIVSGGTDTLWAVGTGGILYQTIDAGVNWERFSVGSTTNLSSIKYFNGTGYVVGKNGKAHRFGKTPVIGINDNLSAEIGIKVFPNPFYSTITIEINQKLSGNTEFLIYDMLGQLVKKVKVTSSLFNVEREGLKSGIYFYQLKNNQITRYSGKLVVE